MHQPTWSSFRIFAVALLCQTVAGVEYWWPALLTSLQPRFHFTPTQSMILSVVANSGSTLSIPAGFFHSRFGSRITTLLGSVVLALSFLILAFLPSGSPRLAFPVTLVICAATVPSSFAVYAGNLSLPAAVFPISFRGRVVGLLSAAYAASSAIYASFQSAFFATPETTTALLITTASITTLAALLMAFFYPNGDDFDTVTKQQASHTYESIPQQHQTDSLVTNRIASAYKLIWVLVAFLQLGALCDAVSASPVLLKGSVAAVFAVLLIILVFVPYKSPLHVRAAASYDSSQSGDIVSVIKDVRFQYIALARFLLVGGGTVTVLIQSPNIAASRLALTQPEAIPAAVRTIVMIFSTSNLTARLVTGLFMDAKTEEESLLRKFNIVHVASLVLAVALPLLSLAPYWGFLVGVVVVGSCHGIFFSAAPALCTLWFGVRDYPRNWSATGPCQFVALATLGSFVPTTLMRHFGRWVTVGEEHYCVGIMCTLPTFAVVAILELTLFVIGWSLKKRTLQTSAHRQSRTVDIHRSHEQF